MLRWVPNGSGNSLCDYGRASKRLSLQMASNSSRLRTNDFKCNPAGGQQFQVSRQDLIKRIVRNQTHGRQLYHGAPGFRPFCLGKSNCKHSRLRETVPSIHYAHFPASSRQVKPELLLQWSWLIPACRGNAQNLGWELASLLNSLRFVLEIKRLRARHPRTTDQGHPFARRSGGTGGRREGGMRGKDAAVPDWRRHEPRVRPARQARGERFVAGQT